MPNLSLLRLRTKLTLLMLGLVLVSMGGTALVATRSFIQDKRHYEQDLNAIAAPQIASAIASKISFLKSQFQVFDELLQSTQESGVGSELLQSTYLKMKDLISLRVSDATGQVIAELGGLAQTPLSHWSQKAQESEVGHFYSMIQSGVHANFLVIRIKKNIYQVQLKPEFFLSTFNLSQALTVALIDDVGQVANQNAGEDLSLSLSSELLEQLQATRDRQSVFAREIKNQQGQEVLSAWSPILGTERAWIWIQTPSAQLGSMVQEILKSALPFALLVLGFSIAMGVLFSSRMSKPIEELTAATARIATGDWNIKIQTRSQDEIGKLVSAFSKMGTELQSREDSLKKATEELFRSESLATLGTFSAGLAHEVKNPLNSILGYAQLIQMKFKPVLDEAGNKYVQFILDETRRASRIISDLLTFARQKPPALSSGSLNQALTRAHEMLTQTALSSGIQFDLSMDQELVTQFDRDQIFQVIQNLVTNACQAMESNPPEKSKRVILGLTRSEQFALIKIEDTGMGIPAENLSKLFRPFFSTKGVGKGTGLGLSLCHGIIEQHKGRIEVLSKEGQGTIFNLYLPLI